VQDSTPVLDNGENIKENDNYFKVLPLLIDNIVYIVFKVF